IEKDNLVVPGILSTRKAEIRNAVDLAPRNHLDEFRIERLHDAFEKATHRVLSINVLSKENLRTTRKAAGNSPALLNAGRQRCDSLLSIDSRDSESFASADERIGEKVLGPVLRRHLGRVEKSCPKLTCFVIERPI